MTDAIEARTVIVDEFEPMLRSAGLIDYESIMNCREGTPLVKPGLGRRERIRLELKTSDGKLQTVYLKRYGDNNPAEIEWEAIKVVQDVGVPTMRPVAMGTGPTGGFVIFTAVPGEALSRCMGDLLTRPGDNAVLSQHLAELLGILAAKLHAAGLAHRDFYTDHIFLDQREDALELYLIDLARVFRPRPLRRQWRWWLKDLAQLKFSLPVWWRERHWSEVRSAYIAQRRRSLPFWGEWIIDLRVRRMTARTARKRAAMAGGGS